MKNISVTVLICFCLILMNCASVGIKIEQSKIKQINKGITTKNEIVHLFGNPNMEILNADGKITMMYIYTKVENKAINFVPIVGSLAGGMDMQQQTLQIIINKDGIVEQYLHTNSNSPIRSGLLNVK